MTELKARSGLRTKGRSVFALTLLGGLLIAGVVPAQADDTEFGAEAKAFVEKMAVRAITALPVSELGKDERRKRFREMMHDYFDFMCIGNRVLCRLFRRASEVECK